MRLMTNSINRRQLRIVAFLIICPVFYLITNILTWDPFPTCKICRNGRSMRIAIIGSSGYIGARLLNDLQQNRDWSIIGYDRKFLGQASHEIETKELRRFHVVIYLGGFTGRKMCMDRPKDVHKENVNDILELSKRMKKGQLLVFASTSAIAEGSGSQALAEDDFVRIELLDLYASSMFSRENVLMRYSKSKSGTPKMIGLRFGTVIGVSPSQRIDLSHMALVCQAFLGGRLHVTHPESYRGFLSMDDLVRAITTILKQPGKINHFEIFNLQSFSANIAHVANSIAHRTSAYVYPSDHEPHKDSIGFSLDTKKFENRFNFKFEDNQNMTISKLLDDVPHLCLGRKSRVDNDSTPCVVCGSTEMHTILNMSTQPLANDFRNNSDDALKCERFPLRLVRCPKCHHTQLSYFVNREYLFSHYLYQSGTSQTLKNYFYWLAQKIINETVKTNGIVLEIACNDGTQLNEFLKRGWKTFGVDPATNLAELARKNGHTVFTGFWGKDTFPLLPSPESLNVILAQNVLAHVENPVQFLNACSSMMNEETKLYIQTSQCEMYETGQFDTIYHEHVSFFTAHSFKKIADLTNLKIINFEITEIHGRSCLVTFQKMRKALDMNNKTLNKEDHSLSVALQNEQITGKTGSWFYVQYEAQVRGMENWMMKQMNRLYEAGHTMVAYGAAAKGMVLLHFLLGGSERKWTLSYVIDDAPLKQNTYCPGTTIPVLPTKTLRQQPANKSLTIVIFAWNFYEEILNRIQKEIENTHIETVHILLPFPEQKLLKLQRNSSKMVAKNRYRLIKWPSVITARRRPIILITHIFNEELLLPYWIRHHASYCDMAIIIDYNSTDRSIDIIEREAPKTWRIVQSRNAAFTTVDVDAEIQEYERQYPEAWKVALTITEFIIHPDLRQELVDSENITDAFIFRSVFVTGDDSYPLKRFEQLILQRTQYICVESAESQIHGITGASRILHRRPQIFYAPGRHELYRPDNIWLHKGFIAKFFFTPWPETINRKLQIKTRIPPSEYQKQFGGHHNVDENQLIATRNQIISQKQCRFDDDTAATDELHMIHTTWREIAD